MKTHWFLKWALSLAAVLVIPTVWGQIKPAHTANDTAVSSAEVNAFMQGIKQDTNGTAPWTLIPSNPKRVPLLLTAIEREPAGPWVMYLQGICFGDEHNRAARLSPDQRAPVYAHAIEYLTSARLTVSNAWQANPTNRALKDSLGTLDAALALAFVESGTRLAEARALADSLLAANTVTNWNYGNLIYSMHSLLGRIALREADLTQARHHLEESGKTPGSPQLNSFGPDFVLARELLEKGEREAVLAHLDRVEAFWAKPDRNPPGPLTGHHQKELSAWRQAIQAGQIPTDGKWQVASPVMVDSTPVDEVAVRNARRQICTNQLKFIEMAKQQWALEKQKPEEAVPTAADLADFLQGGKLPACPDGGSYTLGPLNQKPRCSRPGHELPTNSN
jgi:hypothetical protein